MDGLVAVLSSSKCPETKEDGKLVADHLGVAMTDWPAVASPVLAVQDDIALVRRSHLAMKQAGWSHSFSSAMLEGGRATSGATFIRRWAAVLVLSVVGFGTTRSAAASSVAAMSEEGLSPEENMVTGQPITCGIIKILV